MRWRGVQLSKNNATKPNETEQSPKKRICPSLISSKDVNIRRQAVGEANGNKPSNMSTKANASHKLSDITQALFTCLKRTRHCCGML